MNYVEYNGIRFEIKNNSLSLSSQSITDISEIKGLENKINLISLHLNDNEIENIHNLHFLINLEKLYLDHNQLTEIEGLEKLINLKVLSLGRNRITKIKNISHLVNLEDLFIQGNRIKKIEGLDFSYFVYFHPEVLVRRNAPKDEDCLFLIQSLCNM